MWDLLNCIARKAGQLGVEVFLVGGSVRDLLINRPPVDFDFAVSGNVHSLADLVAKQLNGTVVSLDQSRETLRVVDQNTQLDFNLFKGQSLNDDLKARDFTINAMALPIKTSPNGWVNDLVDPTGGRLDLKTKLLRVTSNTSILNDPLRVLRGVRLAAQLNLSIIPETSVLMKQGASRIEQVAGERVWQELSTILGLPISYPWIEFLDKELHLWQYLIPGRLRMEETRQNYYHVENVWLHCLRTFHCLELIIKELPLLLEESPSLIKHLAKNLGGGRTRLQILKLAALIHDVGKPDTAVIHQAGRISFHGHPEAGLPYAEALAERLRLSREERTCLMNLILYHMHPLHLYTSKEHSEVKVYRLFRTLGQNVLDTLILSLADLTATYTAGERLSELVPYRRFILSLLRSYLCEKRYSPVSYLTGAEIIELGVPQGPLVGELLDNLLEAQVMGVVEDKNSALLWVKRKMQKRENDQ